MSDRVLVTGAGGFLGRHVTRGLLDGGADVVALTGTRPLPDDLAARCAEVAQVDLGTERVPDRLLAGAGAVAHLAAYVPPDFRDPSHAERCLQVNALATLRLAEQAGDVGLFAYAGGANAYAPADEPVDEEHPLWPTTRAPWYLASKALGELYLEALGYQGGPPVCVLRISTPYGPGMPAGSAVMRFLDAARQGGVLTVAQGGVARADLVHVDDVVAALAAAIEGRVTGTFNVASGRSTSMLELARTAVAVAGAGTLDVQPASAPPASFPPLRIDRAETRLGLRPRSLAEGLRGMLAT